MSKLTSFNDYMSTLPKESQDRINERAKATLQAYEIAQLRQNANLSQKALAEKMGVSQANISKIENGSDVYLSTLKRYITTLGGELHINATMPNGENIVIS